MGVFLPLNALIIKYLFGWGAPCRNRPGRGCLCQGRDVCLIGSVQGHPFLCLFVQGGPAGTLAWLEQCLGELASGDFLGLCACSVDIGLWSVSLMPICHHKSQGSAKSILLNVLQL